MASNLNRWIFRQTSRLVRFFYTRLMVGYLGWRYRGYLDQPRAFCLFLGYPRSGHTLIGALLNAHPEMCIAHELNVLKYLRRGHSRRNLYAKLIGRDKWFATLNYRWSGYSYRVPGQWQGSFRELKVIGDKRGGRTSREIYHHPERLDQLRQTTGIPVKIIHIIRNPFDNIATRARGGNDKDQPVDPEMLQNEIDRHFREVEAIHHIRSMNSYQIYELRHEDFIEYPQKYLAGMCRFLGVEPYSDYLEDAGRIVRKSSHKSRHKIKWPRQAIDEVNQRMGPYDFLKGYRFEE